MKSLRQEAEERYAAKKAARKAIQRAERGSSRTPDEFMAEVLRRAKRNAPDEVRRLAVRRAAVLALQRLEEDGVPNNSSGDAGRVKGWMRRSSREWS